MNRDPKDLVESGYDLIAQKYLEWSKPSPACMGYLQKLLKRLPAKTQVLELGCGAEVPFLWILAQSAQ